MPLPVARDHHVHIGTIAQYGLEARQMGKRLELGIIGLGARIHTVEHAIEVECDVDHSSPERSNLEHLEVSHHVIRSTLKHELIRGFPLKRIDRVIAEPLRCVIRITGQLCGRSDNPFCIRGGA